MKGISESKLVIPSTVKVKPTRTKERERERGDLLTVLSRTSGHGQAIAAGG